jgi:hypothetical protein
VPVIALTGDGPACAFPRGIASPIKTAGNIAHDQPKRAAPPEIEGWRKIEMTVNRATNHEGHDIGYCIA